MEKQFGRELDVEIDCWSTAGDEMINFDVFDCETGKKV